MSIQELLAQDLTSFAKLEALYKSLDNLEPRVTHWGGRELVVKGTNEEIPIRKITNKFLDTFDEIRDDWVTNYHDQWRPAFNRFQFKKPAVEGDKELFKKAGDYEKRGDISRDISNKLWAKYSAMDDIIANSNFFIKILAWIRKYFFNSEGYAYFELRYHQDSLSNEFCLPLPY